MPAYADESVTYIDQGWSENEIKRWAQHTKESNEPNYKGVYNTVEHIDGILGSNGEKYDVKYPFKTITTGYGLTREPQWSEGPPPMIEELSPYATIPLPPVFLINPLLAYGDEELTWLVTKPPDFAMPSPTSRAANTYHWQSIPATIPTTSLPFTIFIPPLDIFVEVYPRREVGITIGDVLFAVFDGVRRQSTKIFLEALQLDPRIVDHIGSSGRAPAKLFSGEDEMTVNAQIYMNYRTQWVGLLPSRKHQDVWELHLRPLWR